MSIKNLVIVESPAKAKSIERYLGEGYEVLASYGHVRDLVPRQGAVLPDRDFAMRYEVIARNAKHVEAIRRAASKADVIYLATDPDREGEAIAWHIVQLLDEKGAIKEKPVYRIAFHEITQRAVREAIAQPREISMSLVDAQQARRALDYLVGFNLSPLLWKKIRAGLSAGRVQSPALRLIVEREEERDLFVVREYWTIEAEANKEGQKLFAKLTYLDGKKLDQFDIGTAEAAEDARTRLLAAADSQLVVANVERKQRRRNPAPPFITSTLQQEAVRKLGFSASRAMRVAQQLYEGIDLGSGPVGLISYMRTDSVTLAEEALTEIRAYITERYGKDELPSEPRRYVTKSKNAQEAHEAIRPTSIYRDPASLSQYLSKDQQRLYELVWKRTLACQMHHATLDTVAVDFTAGSAGTLRASGSCVRHAGFLAVYQEGVDDGAEEEERMLPPLVAGETVALSLLSAAQHFTEPPPRYTEATIVKSLEEFGIGRPSTYATIITTLQQRDYVEMESKRFAPTSTGRIVARFLTEHFGAYVDYAFTAQLEDELDAISRGEQRSTPTLAKFWGPFFEKVQSTQRSVTREEVIKPRELGQDPTTGKPVTVQLGRYGAYVQQGGKDDPTAQRASLRPGQQLETITLEEALRLLELPKSLGSTPEGETVTVSIGRYGPYLTVGKTNVSLRHEDPYAVTLDRALELLESKQTQAAKAVLAAFPNSLIEVRQGRWGAYITDGKKNAKIPKDSEPTTLSLDQCQQLLEKAAAAPKRRPPARRAAAPRTNNKSVD